MWSTVHCDEYHWCCYYCAFMLQPVSYEISCQVFVIYCHLFWYHIFSFECFYCDNFGLLYAYLYIELVVSRSETNYVLPQASKRRPQLDFCHETSFSLSFFLTVAMFQRHLQWTCLLQGVSRSSGKNCMYCLWKKVWVFHDLSFPFLSVFLWSGMMKKKY